MTILLLKILFKKLDLCDKADDKYTDTLETLINIICWALHSFKGSEISEKRKILKMLFLEPSAERQKARVQAGFTV